MLDDQIRFARPQLVEPIVASEHRAGKNAAVPRCFDVVLHVTHKQRLARGEFVLAENFQNTRPLVPHFDVRMVKETVKTSQRRLRREMLAMNRAQQKRAQPALATEAQELARVRQFAGQVLDLPEMGVKPLIQLRPRNLWNVAAVEVFERKAKRGPELVERQLSHAGLLENIIGRLPHRRQIVHQRPGPIEDNVPNHRRSLMPTMRPATHKPPPGVSERGND